MKKIQKNAILLALLIMMVSAIPVSDMLACTSVIVSGKATTSGKPMLYKNRDTKALDNAIAYFHGPRFDFIGLVNASAKPYDVWAGTNRAGFSIMNTASYNFKEDNLPDSVMDGEGKLMHMALGCCATVADFQNFLDTLARPMGVEANFGVIDANGGAAYFEVNNTRYVKFDVNDTAVAPKGYRVVTNFCSTGRPEDARGVERYETASAVMSELYLPDVTRCDIDHSFFFQHLSRSYRHEKLGVDYDRNPSSLTAGGRTGYVVDLDFIPRRITSSAIAIEGVAPGQNPLQTVMWAMVGYPACTMAVPLFVGDADHIPSYLKCNGEKHHSALCDLSLGIKDTYIFPDKVSNGTQYLRLDVVLNGADGKPALMDCCRKADRNVETLFGEIYDKWTSGKMSDNQFYAAYDALSRKFLDIFNDSFEPYLVR